MAERKRSGVSPSLGISSSMHWGVMIRDSDVASGIWDQLDSKNGFTLFDCEPSKHDGSSIKILFKRSCKINQRDGLHNREPKTLVALFNTWQAHIHPGNLMRPVSSTLCFGFGKTGRYSHSLPEDEPM